ncbi:hypothetical protein N7U49_48240 (plasmid) [Streptomyces sp. AD2-2]|nr:hypothetical protein N7U49_48240 [Streptomyces sp. AD2-2]
MSTPPRDPAIEAITASEEEGVQDCDATDRPVAYQYLWKRARHPATRKEKNQMLREQRKRTEAARIRRHAAGQSRRPRARQNRIGSAVARRDARALSRLRYIAVWLD